MNILDENVNYEHINPKVGSFRVIQRYDSVKEKYINQYYIEVFKKYWFFWYKWEKFKHPLNNQITINSIDYVNIFSSISKAEIFIEEYKEYLKNEKIKKESNYKTKHRKNVIKYINK